MERNINNYSEHIGESVIVSKSDTGPINLDTRSVLVAITDTGKFIMSNKEDGTEAVWNKAYSEAPHSEDRILYVGDYDKCEALQTRND